jgi:type IX secretion system PorP/SprF family membrane protein
MIIAFLAVIVDINAQEIHFSQFYTTSILTNPANTGISGENFRISSNYRNQWGKIGNPYKTLYTSVDKKVHIANQSFGIGGLVVHDQSSYNLTADQFLISLSYSKFIKNNQFSIGLQPGFAFKSYNLNGVTFGSQFDPADLLFNSDIPSLENNLAGNLHYFDLNIGIYWRTLIRNIMPMAGFSVSHILNPVVSFSTSNNKYRLPVELNFHGQVNIPLSSKIDIVPGLLFSSIPGTSEMVFGSIEGYSLNESSLAVKKIYAINMLRLNPFKNFDALILGGGVKFSKFDLGITYDINISPLSKASYFNGAFELSLIFTGSRQPKRNSNEPCFIY